MSDSQAHPAAPAPAVRAPAVHPAVRAPAVPAIHIMMTVPAPAAPVHPAQVQV